MVACLLAGRQGHAATEQSPGLQLRFNLLMANPSNQPLGPQHAWIYLPAGKSERLTLASVWTPGTHQVETDLLGHNVLHLRADGLPPHGRRAIPLVVSLHSSPMPTEAPDRAAWLAPQQFIESGAEEIIRAASQLQTSTDIDTVRHIYQFVVQNMNYAGYVTEDLGALYALRQRRGDCTEYACLVVALCRAAGIPARMVGGYLSAASYVPKPMDYHNWAEVLIGGRWRVVDSQKQNWLANETQYLAFRYYWDKAINGVGLAHRYRVDGGMDFSM